MHSAKLVGKDGGRRHWTTGEPDSIGCGAQRGHVLLHERLSGKCFCCARHVPARESVVVAVCAESGPAQCCGWSSALLLCCLINTSPGWGGAHSCAIRCNCVGSRGISSNHMLGADGLQEIPAISIGNYLLSAQPGSNMNGNSIHPHGAGVPRKVSRSGTMPASQCPLSPPVLSWVLFPLRGLHNGRRNTACA